MKVKRNNLNDELMSFQQTLSTPTKRNSIPIVINYEQIIEKQSHIIENLYKQCTALRQKINRIKSEQIFFIEAQSSSQNNSMQKFAQMIQSELLKQIGLMLQIQPQQISKTKIMQTIKRFKWQRQKKAQPIFIQKIKEVRIPVPIETIVQKAVQKIVIQERIVQVPVFRQKIVQRFILKVQQNDPFLPTVSKLSAEEGKNKNSNEIQKSEQSLVLSTNSTLKVHKKQQSNNQKLEKKQTKKSQKCQFYRPDKKQYQGFAISKKLSLSDIKQDPSTINRTQIYDKHNQLPKKSYMNSKGSRNSAKSPKYDKNNDFRQNYKYDYRNEEQVSNYHRRSNYQDEKDDKYYKNSYDNNRTVYSPKSNNQDKYYEGDYAFDKSKFLDSSKIGSNKNIKRRDKYDYYDRQK